MDLGLTGKRALVTGSTKGIGFATAKLLASEGAHVVIHGSRDETVNEAIEQLDRGDRVSGIAADLSTGEGCAKLAEKASEGGTIDVLVNNAGIFEAVDFEEISDDEWTRFYDINVMSGVRLSRALMGPMRENGWGRIVFVSSESGLNIPVEMVHYGMTKTAQIAVMRGLAKTLAGTGVTSNAVLPGPTWTEGVADFVEEAAKKNGVSVDEMKEKFVKEARPNSIIGRFGEPGEVAAMIAFTCSERASSTTGASMRVEGGIIENF